MLSSPVLKQEVPASNLGHKSTQRVVSIDILRALIMVLMIFVNDLWSLHNIPLWLEHVAPGVDGIGLADTVFPAFLFIVGLSLPFAIDNRRNKGDSQWELVKHVLTRSIALLVMGVFLVNGETLNADAMGMQPNVYDALCCISFILIWNLYPKTFNKNIVYLLKFIGIASLITLAILYRGKENGIIERFAPHWWGILGLIGWSYLAAGLITVFAKNKFSVIISAWIFFCVLSMAAKAGFVPGLILNYIPESISGGTLAGLTMGGVLTSLIFQYFRAKKNNKRLTLFYLAFSVLLITLSIVTRPYWKLAKLGATPAWLFLCSAFTILAFLAIYWITDVYGKANWFKIIKPAGTDTLLCYLMPYFVYFLLTIFHFTLPEAILSGGVGLLKSLLFAILCVFIAGKLNKLGVRLKL